MSNIEELIEQLCPEGVEWKKLGDVCKFQNGFAFKSGLFKFSGLPIIRITNIQNRNVEDLNLVYFDKADYNESLSQYIIEKGDILIAMSGATTGKIGYVASNELFYLNQRVGKFIPHANILNNRFLFHFLLTKTNEMYVMAGGGAQPNLSSIKLMKGLSIPLPPLSIQHEIVSILDKLTQLQTELEAELQARRAQYEYYRNELLNFEGKEVEWKTLNQISKNFDSKRKPVTRSDRESGEYPYYGASGIVDYVRDYIFDGDYLLISEDGANLIARNTPIAFSITGKTWVNNHAHVLKFDNYATRRFVEIYLNSIDLSKYITGAAQPKLNQENLNKISIPISPLPEQERIVAILDKFDALLNSKTKGLPAEIEARRKQYEYYRGKLLDFKELKN